MPPNDKPPLLLVDDESEIINVLQMMFTQKGQPVIVANSGSAALELLNKRVNDLTTHYVRAIVSDWMMPNLNGLELLAKVRSTEALKGIPFVLMSGNVTKDELLAAVRYDLDAVILKPFGVQELQTKINEAVAKREVKSLERLMQK